MSIHYKLLFFFLLQHLIFLLIAIFLSENFIRPHNLSVENKNAEVKIKQIQYVLHSELRQLELLNQDWAIWDNMYDFMQGENKNFIMNNFHDEVLDTVNLDRIEIFDLEGRSVYFKTGTNIHINSLFDDQKKLKKEYLHWNKVNQAQSLKGVIKLNNKVVLISLHPIVKGNNTGPIIGTLLMLREIDDIFISKINKSTDTNISFLSLSDFSSLKQIQDKGFSKEAISDEILILSTYMNGLDKTPSIIIQTHMRREFMIESNNLIFYLYIVAGILGFLSFLISFYLLKREIVSPLKSLGDHILKIRKEQTLTPSLLARREDEIGVLAKEFNVLLLDVDEKNTTLSKVARIDSLTNVANRLDLDERFDSEKKMSFRENEEMSVLMLDIDYFKNYNDFYGHVKGDAVLVEIAKAIKGSGLRPRDYVARYGGEEFIIILPKTHSNGAVIVAKRILNNIKALKIEHKTSELEGKILSASIGCLTLVAEPKESAEYIISLADEALYRAKEEGRDRFHIYHRELNKY